jgi:hypothetical protein
MIYFIKYQKKEFKQELVTKKFQLHNYFMPLNEISGRYIIQ